MCSTENGFKVEGNLKEKKKENKLVICPIECFTQLIGKGEQVKDLSLLLQEMRRISVFSRWDGNANKYERGFLRSSCAQAWTLTA